MILTQFIKMSKVVGNIAINIPDKAYLIYYFELAIGVNLG